jgi:hypothetical protein
MFIEQVQSREALSDLAAGRIASLSLGTPETTENSATVPLTAVFKDGTKIHGTMTLANYHGLWYFFSLGRSGRASGEAADSPTEFDSDVVAAISEEQGKAGTQDLIKNGVLGGGFTKITVDAVHPGVRTATIDVTLSGGNEAPVEGRLVCVSKSDVGVTYWFVASFEKR